MLLVRPGSGDQELKLSASLRHVSKRCRDRLMFVTKESMQAGKKERDFDVSGSRLKAAGFDKRPGSNGANVSSGACQSFALILMMILI